MQNKTAYIWGIASRFLPQTIYLGTTMILARFLTPDDFGEIGVLSIIFLVANILLDSGLGGSLVKEKFITPIDCSTIQIFNLIVSLFIYLFLFLSASIFESFFEIDGISNVLRVISLVFPISAFGIVPKAILNRGLKFKIVFYNSLIGVIVGSISAIFLAVNGGGVYALVSYQIVNVATSVFFNYISSKYKFSIAFSLFSLKKLLPFGVLTTLVTVIDTVYENLITTLTGKYLNVQQAGYMYQAKRIEETMSNSLAVAISTVAFPVLTKIKDDKVLFLKEADSTFKTLVCLTFPLLMCVAIFSKEIVFFLFGEQWLAAAFYLEALTFAGMFILMETLIRNFIKALCEVRKLFYATLFKRSIGIIIILIATMISPSLAIYAYIISSLIAYIVNMALYCFLLHNSFFKRFIECFVYLFPSLILYILLKYSFVADCDLLIKIMISFILLLIIYFIALPLLGVNILNWLRKTT